MDSSLKLCIFSIIRPLHTYRTWEGTLPTTKVYQALIMHEFEWKIDYVIENSYQPKVIIFINTFKWFINIV